MGSTIMRGMAQINEDFHKLKKVIGIKKMKFYLKVYW